MTRKRAAALFLAILFAIAAAGCGTETPKGKLKIALIVKAEASTFFQTVLEGAKAAGSEYDAEIVFAGSGEEDDYAYQNALILEAIEDGADAVILSACDYDKTVPYAEKVLDAGIPLVTIDSGINTDRDVLFIGTDNYAAGQMAARELAGLTGGKAVVGIVNFEAGTGNAIERYQGFIDELKNYPDMKVADTRSSKSNIDAPLADTLDIFEKHPDVNAIVALNEWTTIGAGAAAKTAGLGNKTYVVGFDNNVRSIGMLEDGDIDTLILQNPFAMGYLGVKYAIDEIEGKSVPANVSTVTAPINQENMYMAENQKLLFPFTD